MAEILLDVLTRDVKKEKNNSLRREGVIPAIVYGHGKENRPIKLTRKDFLKKLHGNIASNIFIDLKIDSEEKPSKTVFIKKVQREVMSREIEHIDFIEINPDEKIHIAIPVILTGTAAGIVAGGLTEFLLRSIDVECLPKDTPKNITVDVTNLNIGESIHARDLKLPENVRLVTAGIKTIVSIVERKEEVVETPVAAEGAAAAAADGTPEAAAATASGEPAKAGDAKAGAKGADAKAPAKAPAKGADAKGADSKSKK